MSDTPPPEWLGPATDRLKDVGLDEAAGWLTDYLALVEFAEGEIRDQWDESTRRTHVSAVGHPYWGRLLAIVAKARGETPERAFERLAPTWHVPEEAPRERYCDRVEPPRNQWAAAIDMAPLIERELDRQRRDVEDFLRENHADPAIHEHVIYPGPGDGAPDYGRDRPVNVLRASHVHALIPWADTEARGSRPTRDEVMAPGSRWPWRLI